MLRTLGDIIYFISLIIWIMALFLGLMLLLKEFSVQLLIWNLIWFTSGLWISRTSFWYSGGRQQLYLDDNFLIIKKKLGPLRGTRTIKTDEIEKLEIKVFSPFNPLTGRDIKTKEQLGQLKIITHNRTRTEHHLYTLVELKEFIDKFEKSKY